MRSEKVEKSINNLNHDKEIYFVDMHYREVTTCRVEDLDNVLNYITELETKLENLGEVKILISRSNGKTLTIAKAIEGVAKEVVKNKKAIEYIKQKQKIQYKYSLSQIECEELLTILQEEGENKS